MEHGDGSGAYSGVSEGSGAYSGVSEGSAAGSGDVIEYGTVVTYTCNIGYVLTGGDALRTCSDEGEWSGGEPTCDCMFAN